MNNPIELRVILDDDARADMKSRRGMEAMPTDEELRDEVEDAIWRYFNQSIQVEVLSLGDQQRIRVGFSETDKEAMALINKMANRLRAQQGDLSEVKWIVDAMPDFTDEQLSAIQVALTATATRRWPS